MPTDKNTVIAGTLQTDPRSGGLKRSSGVNVLPVVAESRYCNTLFTPFQILNLFPISPAWSEVRDNANTSVDWLIASYVEGSKSDITVIAKGSGGPAECSKALSETDPCFGGCKTSNGRFRGFYYCPEGCGAMKKGRASMHKNGVLNILEGRDGEVPMEPGYSE